MRSGFSGEIDVTYGMPKPADPPDEFTSQAARGRCGLVFLDGAVVCHLTSFTLLAGDAR